MPSKKHQEKLDYRPDIDGLRALAVFFVVIFHAFPARLQGGFVGVDIFFVISGYLISSIVFKSLSCEQFSFIRFYAHRVRRIFPALVVVLVACFAFGWFALLPDEFKQLGKHMAASAGFVQNVALLREDGYFDTAAEFKPLLHLWSLAIEEQFYLVYPILIVIAWRLGLNTLALVLFLVLFSFGLNVLGVSEDPPKTFFMLQTRAWELLVGAVLAYLQCFGMPCFLRRCVASASTFSSARHLQQFGQHGEALKNILSTLGLVRKRPTNTV